MTDVGVLSELAVEGVEQGLDSVHDDEPLPQLSPTQRHSFSPQTEYLKFQRDSIVKLHERNLMSIMNPEVPGKAFREFLDRRASEMGTLEPWSPADGPLPSIYLSHGAPPVFDDTPLDEPAVRVVTHPAQAERDPRDQRPLGISTSHVVVSRAGHTVGL